MLDKQTVPFGTGVLRAQRVFHKLSRRANGYLFPRSTGEQISMCINGVHCITETPWSLSVSSTPHL